MRWKYAWFIASLLAMGGCDDGGDTGEVPMPDAEIRDGGGAGGDGGMGGEADMGDGGDGGMGGEADMGDGGDGGMGGEADMGMGGAGGGEVDMAMPMPACADGVDNDEDGLVDLDDPGCEDAADDDETDPPLLCANGVDDDDDGLIDLDDPGCESGADFTEDDPAERPACANDADDDGDGAIDFPADVGCQAAGDTDETDEATPRACSNGADDDEDGLTDYPNDPGCGGPGDHDETDPEGLPACGNGIDDDEDGATDYPADNGCEAAGDYDERLVCAGNGHQILDLNAAIAADGYIDGTTAGAQATEQGSCGGMAGGEQVFVYQVGERLARVTFTTLFEETAVPTVIYVRRACAAAEDLACNRGSSEIPGTTAVLERPEPGLYYVVVDTSSRQVGEGAFRLGATEEALPACDDTVDNDEDGLTDFPNDPGCESIDDADETSPDPLPACADGIDNDGDELIDFPDDAECEGAFDDSENRVGCLEDPNLIIVDNRSARFELNTANNNAGYTASCGNNASGPEQVFLVQVRQPSGLRVETLPPAEGAQIDTVLHVRANDCDMGQEIQCNDDGGAGTLSLIQLDALDPGNYYVFADRYGDGAGGPMAVQIDVVPLGAVCEDGRDNDADGLIDAEDPGCAGPDDDDEADADPPVVAACANGADDDADGLIDYPLDPGCNGIGDDDEADLDPAPACANGEDDDEDGLVDFPADPGCAAPGDLSEGNLLQAPACSNGADDDGDNLVDAEDPGCNGPGDLSEVDPMAGAACANGVDDDGDMLIDFPFDPGCRGPGDLSEADPAALAQCADGVDNDEDGVTDFPGEPGCASAADDDETDPDPAPDCGNGEDDDEDGLVDFPADPGCAFAGDQSEINPAACANGLDDDDDGAIDLDDPGCFGALDDDETDPAEAPACANGVDDDEDGDTDYPADADCAAAGGPQESPICGEINMPTIHVGQAGGQVSFVPEIGPDLVTGGCIFGADGNETLIVLTLDQPSTVTAVFDGQVSRFARTICDDINTEFACESGFSDDPITLFEADAGQYYFFVEPDGIDPIPVTATFDVRPLARPCADGVDNDDDGLIDFNDPGCIDPTDIDEADPVAPPVCNDGIDNDDDGAIDLEDPDCSYAGGTSEQPLCPDLDVNLIQVAPGGGAYDFFLRDGDGVTAGSCDDGGAEEQAFAITIDEPSHVTVTVTDADGPAETILYLRSTCGAPATELACDQEAGGSQINVRDLQPGTYYAFVERESFTPAAVFTATVEVVSAITECNDGADNDADGAIDLLDPGCVNGDDESEADPVEPPACADGVDNDDDGLIDYPDDFGCSAAGDDGESLACEATEDVVEVNLDLADPEPLVFQFNTEGQENLFNASCGFNSASPEAVYALIVPAAVGGFIEITDGGGRDTTLHMRAACDDQGTEIACNDDGGQGVLSRLDFVRLEAGIYYVFADGYGNRAGGAGELTIALQPAAAACGNGIDDDGDSLVDDEDPGCDSPDDDDEFNEPLPQCSNRIDDDGDGLIDAEDDGCDGPDDDDEFVPPVCGDGNIEGPENCDDGNAEPGDGCDALCQLEEAPDEGTIRLKDGPAGNFGRLEVYGNDTWGTVCDDGWVGAQGLINGEVACRELGFIGLAEVVLDGYDGADPQPILLDDVACVGDEERVRDCDASPIGVENCSHFEDFALRCLLPGECRLDVHCEDGLDCVEGVCGVAPPACSNGLDDDGDGLIDGDDNGCDGPDDDDEATVPVCGDGAIQGLENCDDGNLDAGDGCDAECQPEAAPEEGAIRLKDGPVPFLGRLEVYANDAWGTVCDDGWFGDQAFVNADVACQQLGYAGALEVIDGLDGADPQPILLDDVACVGDEETLLACPSAGVGVENCGHSEDIGLRCLVGEQCRIDLHCAEGEMCVENVCVEPPPPMQ